MGHKVHPYVFRLNVSTDWKSRWFAAKNYHKLLEQDVKIRDFIMKKLGRAGINSVEIERSANLVNVIIETARPGLIIGRGGSGSEELRKQIKGLLAKLISDGESPEVRLEIQEAKNPNSQAAVVAMDMAVQIEKRMPVRRVMKQTLDKVMQDRGVEGAKVMVSGRLNGAEIARSEWLKKGKISLQTLRSSVDYSLATAYTTYGTIGIKVWIYKGEIFNKAK